MTVQVFVTVGTSALSKFPPKGWEKREDDLIKRLRKNEADFFRTCREDMATNITHRLNSYQGEADRRAFHRYSAELGSLLAMKGQGDMLDADPGKNLIYLLHTDTTEGRLCAEVIAEAIKNATDHAGLANSVKILKIEHLSVDDPEKFKNGLENLKRLIQDNCSQDPKVFKIFNITGGYKALIPYAAVLAWDELMDVCYLYEGNNNLMVIKRPVSWMSVFRNIVDTTEIHILMPPR